MKNEKRPENRINLRFARCILYFALCVATLSGCDPITRHKALSTIFDGVPSLPPAEDYCAAYAEKVLAAERAGIVKKGQDGGENEKPTGGLVLPARELCLSCHTDFIKGAYVHGPAAVGDCLACHLPHTSNYESLLVRKKSELCAACHKEKRLAAEMHDRLVKKGMECTDCHNPHYGQAKYFLK